MWRAGADSALGIVQCSDEVQSQRKTEADVGVFHTWTAPDVSVKLFTQPSYRDAHTAQGAARNTRSVTEPISRRSSAPRPWVPITIRSAFMSCAV